MEPKTKDIQIVKIIQQNELEVTQAEVLLQPLIDFLEQAKVWEVRAKAIVVTDVSQVKEMAEARAARLMLRKIRTNADNTREELKKRSLREGRAIDGVGNIIKAVIVPLEEHLEKQEKFAEEVERKAKEELYNSRLSALQPYQADPSLYNLKEMSEESFSILLDSIKVSFENKKELDRKIEEDRIKIEKEKIEEDKKMREENIRIKKEQEEKDKIHKIEKDEADRKIRDAEEEKKKLEKQIADKKKIDDEIAHKELVRKQEEAAEEQKARSAPDKEKLLAFANSLNEIRLPELSEEASKTILKSAVAKILEVKHEIENKLLKF